MSNSYFTFCLSQKDKKSVRNPNSGFKGIGPAASGHRRLRCSGLSYRKGREGGELCIPRNHPFLPFSAPPSLSSSPFPTDNNAEDRRPLFSAIAPFSEGLMLPTATESGVKITVLPPTILAQMICDCTVLRPDIGGFQLESTLRSRHNQSVWAQSGLSRDEVREVEPYVPGRH